MFMTLVTLFRRWIDCMEHDSATIRTCHVHGLVSGSGDPYHLATRYAVVLCSESLDQITAVEKIIGTLVDKAPGLHRFKW